MPASRSFSRGAEPAVPRRSIWPWILIGAGAVFAVAAASLPASIVRHFLPPSVQAEDFSGSLWHGSAGKLTVNSRGAGAVEWRLHPAALLRLTIAAEVHWVKVGFVIDGTASVSRRGFTARDITGGGPIEDLHDLGVAANWRGNAGIEFSRLEGDLPKPSAAVGTITVSNLASSQWAGGEEWGSYELRLSEGSVGDDGSITAQLNDTGGPVELRANLRLSPAEHSGLLSGTLRERPDAPQGIRSQIDSLSQVRPRDAQGRIPVDLEFTF